MLPEAATWFEDKPGVVCSKKAVTRCFCTVPHLRITTILADGQSGSPASRFLRTLDKARYPGMPMACRPALSDQCDACAIKRLTWKGVSSHPDLPLHAVLSQDPWLACEAAKAISRLGGIIIALCFVVLSTLLAAPCLAKEHKVLHEHLVELTPKELREVADKIGLNVSERRTWLHFVHHGRCSLEHANFMNKRPFRGVVAEHSSSQGLTDLGASRPIGSGVPSVNLGSRSVWSTATPWKVTGVEETRRKSHSTYAPLPPSLPSMVPLGRLMKPAVILKTKKQVMPDESPVPAIGDLPTQLPNCLGQH